MSTSPFAPSAFPDLPHIDGVSARTAATGARYKNREDLFLAAFAPDTVAAGVLTRSRMPAAPVDWCRKLLSTGKAGGLVVNAGNANAFTGTEGAHFVHLSAKAVGKHLNCAPETVYVASTGVIGELPDFVPLEAGIAAAAEKPGPGGWEPSARAIMTTDTYPKGAGCHTRIHDTPVHVAGIAKGSGMIAPDMGTMLAFIFTDAALPAPVLQTLVSRHAETTFNRISVDGDTSTSDTLLVFATGAAKNSPARRADDPALADFSRALHTVMEDLALQVVKDGEGLTKFAEITVTGAEDDRAAHRTGLAVANSPLVKTALAGEDPNWGRLVMAVGKSGEKADRDKIGIHLGDVRVACDGRRDPAYTEDAGAAVMKRAEIPIRLDLGVGPGRATVWTCDLSAGYIRINADYRS